MDFEQLKTFQHVALTHAAQAFLEIATVARQDYYATLSSSRMAN